MPSGPNCLSPPGIPLLRLLCLLILLMDLGLCFLPLPSSSAADQPNALNPLPPPSSHSSSSVADECGRPELDLLPPPDAQLVYRGADVVLDSYLPWMAFVLGPAICTATIVSRNFVLSAGHCVNAGSGKAFPANSVTVYAGSANLSSAIPLAVERVVLRSEYADRHDDQIGSVTMADMALLKLAVPLNFTETLRPICLSGDVPNGGEVLVAGWGNTKPHCETSIIWRLTHPKIPERLQFGRERVLPSGECVDLELRWLLGELEKTNGSEASGANGPVAPNQRELRRRIAAKMTDKICVIGDKEPNTVVESGDSGGPLLKSLGQGRWAQVGTLTGGPCHAKEAPLHDYYTKIDCEWIAIQTEEEVQCQ